jgi:hypothetical protein
VREHYVAYSLVRQCRDDFSLDTKTAEESFGVLRRALSDPDIRNFIGLDLDKPEQQLRKPIPRGKHREVGELLVWMFGTDDAPAALKDSRDLKKLGLVLEKSETVEVLRSTGKIEYAYELTGGEEARLVDFLGKASYFLDQALPMMVRHRTSKKVILAVERCEETFEALTKLMKND